MRDDDLTKLPNQQQLEKELSEYLSQKYGYRIKVVSSMTGSQTKISAEGQKKQDGVDKIDFDLKPEEMETYLDQYVIKQADAKAVLATKIE
jgi:ATP-dependent protease Clp ATPase subunit